MKATYLQKIRQVAKHILTICLIPTLLLITFSSYKWHFNIMDCGCLIALYFFSFSGHRYISFGRKKYIIIYLSFLIGYLPPDLILFSILASFKVEFHRKHCEWQYCNLQYCIIYYPESVTFSFLLCIVIFRRYPLSILFKLG